jgi:hypothetical protein
MSFVRTLLRWLLTASLAAACAAQPIALDACRAACDSARSARAAAAPACHRAAGSQVGQPSPSCGQEHAVVPADPGVAAQPLSVAPIDSPPPLFNDSVLRAAVADSSAGPPPIPISLESNTPMRV